MPAYSQSTMRIDAPSSMKFAFNRSLWQSTAGSGRSARSMSTAMGRARSCAAGSWPPCRVVVSAYASTTRKGENPPERLRDPLQHDWLVDRVVGDRPSHDEARHQHTLRFDEADHLGANAAGGGQPAGLVLEPAIDTEQAAGLRGNPHYEDIAVDLDAVIPVGDAAAERFDLSRAARPTGHTI